MTRKSKLKIRPDWLSKTFAGLALGLALALAISVLFCLLGVGYLDQSLLPQIGMWLVPWLWMPLFFIAYFFPKGWQAVGCYLFLNLIAYALVFWLRA